MQQKVLQAQVENPSPVWILARQQGAAHGSSGLGADCIVGKGEVDEGPAAGRLALAGLDCLCHRRCALRAYLIAGQQEPLQLGVERPAALCALPRCDNTGNGCRPNIPNAVLAEQQLLERPAVLPCSAGLLLRGQCLREGRRARYSHANAMQVEGGESCVETPATVAGCCAGSESGRQRRHPLVQQVIIRQVDPLQHVVKAPRSVSSLAGHERRCDRLRSSAGDAHLGVSERGQLVIEYPARLASSGFGSQLVAR
mmetsp:Transcript_35759/g.89843  ORF Transcript_35759/g.89843 Transcript_35759/m.89843 type:complete len:255 (-) Transcript_35759:532-1296(-)